jgi:hypothetical protein
MAPLRIHPDPKKAFALELYDVQRRTEAASEKNTIARNPFQIPEHVRMRDCLLMPPPALNWHRAGCPPASPGLSWSWFTHQEPDFRSYYLQQRSREDRRDTERNEKEVKELTVEVRMDPCCAVQDSLVDWTYRPRESLNILAVSGRGIGIRLHVGDGREGRD